LGVRNPFSIAWHFEKKTIAQGGENYCIIKTQIEYVKRKQRKIKRFQIAGLCEPLLVKIDIGTRLIKES
jgi:hypothetical protein